jgi:hypothetical protein
VRRLFDIALMIVGFIFIDAFMATPFIFRYAQSLWLRCLFLYRLQYKQRSDKRRGHKLRSK